MWRQKYDGNPIFKIDNAMDATAILMVAAAKSDGDMTKEDKSQILNLFEIEFDLTKKDAAGHLISSVHLLGEGSDVRNNVEKFLSSSKANFTETQAKSALSLIQRASGDEASRHMNAQELLNNVEKVLQLPQSTDQTW